jgi:GcrA cell cycle regulator
MQSNWPPAHSEALREYHARGMSYSMIADAINVRFRTAYSRNATLGRAQRMGLAGADQRKSEPESPTVVTSNLPETSPDASLFRIRRRATSEPWRRPPVFKAIKVARLRCADVVPRHLSLIDLERCDCRYPYGGDADSETITFCGHPRRRGSSYCAAHFKLSIGPGTAAERDADRVLLKIAEAVEA